MTFHEEEVWIFSGVTQFQFEGISCHYNWYLHSATVEVGFSVTLVPNVRCTFNA